MILSQRQNPSGSDCEAGSSPALPTTGISSKSDSSAVLLPGAGYLPAAPLLWFAREALQTDGWTVLQVWDEWDRAEDAARWVTDRYDAAITFIGAVPTRLIVAKSLTTLAIPDSADQGIPGVWLTPLLAEAKVRTTLEASTVPTLLIGGTADATWDTELVHVLETAEALEIEGADHSLQFPGDPRSSIDALMVITDRIRGFAEKL